MNQIPKVTVAPSEDGGWRATCSRIGCGFSFFHILRQVVDEQAINHQRNDMKKARP